MNTQQRVRKHRIVDSDSDNDNDNHNDHKDNAKNELTLEGREGDDDDDSSQDDDSFVPFELRRDSADNSWESDE